MMNRFISLPNYRYYDSESGVLEKSVGKPLRNYNIFGNSVQEGTPSPENPVEIQSVGDLTSKNLLPYPYNYTTKTINGITFTDNGDGSITANGTATANAYFIMVGMSWEEEIPFSAGTYTLSGCPCGGSLNTYALSLGGRTSANDNRNIYAQDIGYGKTVTINNGRYDFIIAIYSGTTVENLIFKPQLESGSTVTEYEPYHKYDIPIILTGTNSITEHIYLNEPLRMIGAYADYIDFKNQRIMRHILKRTLTANQLTTITSVRSYFGIEVPAANKGISTIGSCVYKYDFTGSFHWYLTTSGTNRLALISPSEDMTLGEYFSSIGQNNNVDFYYAVQNPYEEALNLPDLTTFRGTNVILVGTEIQPSKFTLQYYKG